MYRIGVDLGGISIQVGIVSKNGEIIAKKTIPTLKYRGISIIVEDIAKTILDVVAEAGLDIKKDIRSIGIGTKGTPDKKNGLIIYSSYFDFHDAPIRAEMKKYIDLPVCVENNARCSALAESKFGAAKGYQNSVTILLGYTIGAGIIIDGKLYSGGFFGAGEVGHQVIVMDGEECVCGRQGCWEAYASAAAVVREARIEAIRHPESEMFKMVNGDLRIMSYKTPFEAARMGDEYAIHVVNQYRRYLAVGFINIINLLQPNAIVISGRMSEQGNELVDPLREIIATKIYGDHKELKTDICLTQIGKNATMIGAAIASGLDKNCNCK